MNVYFVLAGETDFAALQCLDPDRDWQHFITGERAWVLQTFLRLQAAGVPVQLIDRLPEDGIAIFSSKQRKLLLQQQRHLRTTALLVAIREDVSSTPYAHLDLVQNPSQVRSGRAILMPLWPQPGLIPRDVQRGDTLVNIAFKGFSGNLHPSFGSAEWRGFIARRGLTWTADAVPYTGARTQHSGLYWNDFSTTDLIVAVRPDDPRGHPRKPATKLYNAWLAGTPAILGPEVAYRALRRDPLDYIEVRDSREAAAAIDALLSDRARYRAMIEHGRARSHEFSVPAIIRLWQELIDTTLARHASAIANRAPRPLWWRHLRGRIRLALAK
jgi:hypothetical protein